MGQSSFDYNQRHVILISGGYWSTLTQSHLFLTAKRLIFQFNYLVRNRMHEKYFPVITRNTIFQAVLIAKPIVGLMIQAFPVKSIPAHHRSNDVTHKSILFAFHAQLLRLVVTTNCAINEGPSFARTFVRSFVRSLFGIVKILVQLWIEVRQVKLLSQLYLNEAGNFRLQI